MFLNVSSGSAGRAAGHRSGPGHHRGAALRHRGGAKYATMHHRCPWRLFVHESHYFLYGPLSCWPGLGGALSPRSLALAAAGAAGRWWPPPPPREAASHKVMTRWLGGRREGQEQQAQRGASSYTPATATLLRPQNVRIEPLLFAARASMAPVALSCFRPASAKPEGHSDQTWTLPSLRRNSMTRE